MSISEKDIQELENKYKKSLYDKMEELYPILTELILQIERKGTEFNIEANLPNIGITFNNKLNELSQQFKKSEISMFVEPNEEYNLILPNFVGDAIIDDMISYIQRATQALNEYQSSFGEIINRKTEKIEAIETAGPIKKLFFKIRSLFAPSTITDMTKISDEEIQELNSYLTEYKDIDKKLWNYNLRDNVGQSLVNFIISKRYSNYIIPELLEEYVIPTLKKLEMEDIVPDLKESLSKAEEQSTLPTDKSWKLPDSKRLKIQSDPIAKDLETREPPKKEEGHGKDLEL